MNPIRSLPRRRTRLAVLLGVMLLVGSVAGVGLSLHSRADEGSAPAPSVPRSQRRAVAIGHVDVPSGVAKLYPLQPGLVVRIEARENEEVEAGTPLFYLDDTVAQAQLVQAEADLRSAEEQLAQARLLPQQLRDKIAAQKKVIEGKRHQAAAAAHRHDQARRLAEKKLGSSEEAAAADEVARALESAVEAEQAQLRLLESSDPSHEIARAEQQIEEKQAQRRKALFALKHCTVWAPSKGAVLRTLVHEGETLGPNPQQPAMLFCPAEPRIIRAEIEQEFANRVAVGDSALIQDDSTATGRWQGKVVRLSQWYGQRRSMIQEPLQFNDVRTLECIIELAPNQPPLRIGQRMRVLLEGS